MGTAAGIIYNPAYVTAVYSIALGPVKRKEYFSERERPKDKRKSPRDGLFERILQEEKDNNRLFEDTDIRTIDLIA